MRRALFILLLSALARAQGVDARKTTQIAEQRETPELALTLELYGSHNPTWKGVHAGLSASREVGQSSFYLAPGIDLNSSYVTPNIGFGVDLPRFVKLELRYDAFAFLGKDGALLRFPSADVPYGDDAVESLAGTEQGGFAHRWRVQATLYESFGPVMFVVQGVGALYHLASEPAIWLDWESDKLLERLDGVFMGRAAIVWKAVETSSLTFAVAPYYEVSTSVITSLVRQRVGGTGRVRVPLGQNGNSITIGWAFGDNVHDPNRQNQLYVLTDIAAEIMLR